MKKKFKNIIEMIYKGMTPLAILFLVVLVLIFIDGGGITTRAFIIFILFFGVYILLHVLVNKK